MNLFESGTINRLAEKLESMELADDERAALECILDRAGDSADEVAGFGSFDMKPSGEVVKQEQAAKVAAPDLSVAGIKIADALGWRRF